MISVFNIDEYL